MQIEIKDFIKDTEEVRKKFPGLYYMVDTREIRGRIVFHSYYENEGTEDTPYWVIKPVEDNNQVLDLKGNYSIRISFSQKDDTISIYFAKVYETQGRIRDTARRMRKPLKDLHLNQDNDNSCCLGVFDNRPLSLLEFVETRIYPYLVWQAYYDKYGKTPPCGECPHEKNKAYETRLNEERNKRAYLNTISPKGSNRNVPCPCGSRKKYKKCCWRKNKEKKEEIEFRIDFFSKQLTNKKHPSANAE